MLHRLTLPERFAVLGALLFLVVGSVFTYMDFRMAIERIEAIGHNANTVAIRTLWGHIRPVALPLLGTSDRGPLTPHTKELLIEQIESRTRETINDTDIDKIKIYDGMGRVLYSTDRAQIGDDEGHNPRFLRAISGEELSRKEHFDRFLTVDGPQRDVVMQATYIPVYASGSDESPIGVFEIYRNFTAIQKATQWRAWLRLAGLVTGLAILYGLLVFIVTYSHRALQKSERERRIAEAEVVKVRAEDASKSAFIAHMSHELRTPLNAIIGFSEFIEKARALNLAEAKIMEYAGDIRSSAVHLLRIINDLLDLTRLDLGRIKPEVDDVELESLFNEALLMVRTQADQGGVTLVSDFTALPRIRTDRQRVKQILVNLLSNAVKFTPEDGTITAAITFEPERGMIALRVIDTGIGMSGDETSDRLNILRYGDAMITRKLAGVGLGLPLCQRYARLLDGDLRIESELGKGTTVTLEIPFKPSVPEQTHRAGQAAA